MKGIAVSLPEQEPFDFTEPEPSRICLTGEIDAATAPGVARQLAEHPAGADVEVDLSQVHFLGAAGLTLLLELRNRLADGGARLYLTGASEFVDRLFVLVGLREPHPDGPAARSSRPARMVTRPARAHRSDLPGAYWLTVDGAGRARHLRVLDDRPMLRRGRPRPGAVSGPWTPGRPSSVEEEERRRVD